jgi:catechol 2,3-dioxygenase-like lactoylglutathione lyase family enzyme
MKFSSTLIAVRDMESSLKFYKDLFDQDVVLDLGWCKTLSCGLTLQYNFDRIAGFDAGTMKFKSNTMELYFETEDFDVFIRLLEKHPEIERVHDPKTYPWLQRSIHFYDPDGHMIEVGESMESVAHHEFEKGHSAEEVAQMTEHPIGLVKEWEAGYMAKHKPLTVCGTDCLACGCFGTLCKGCNECEGKVFHSPDGCSIYTCVRIEKKLHDCGKCDKLPCEIWQKTRDPKFTDEEFRQNIAARVQALKTTQG